MEDPELFYKLGRFASDTILTFKLKTPLINPSDRILIIMVVTCLGV